MNDTIQLTHAGMKHRVSSTLNKSAEFSSKHMFDGNSDTCWNSAQGSPQFIILDFGRRVAVAELQIMFQGGFVGQDALVEVGGGDEEQQCPPTSATQGANSTPPLKEAAKIEVIDDSNDLQKFSFSPNLVCRVLKLTFQSSTDFYGRVTIYKLIAMGSILE